MGGGNSVKKIARGAVDITERVMNPSYAIRETGRALGLTGIKDLGRKGTDIGQGLTQMATGEMQEKKKAAKDAAATMQKQMFAANAARQATAAEEARLSEDKARIAEGTSKSQTLLTGGTGLLDDEDATLTRRMLMGR